MVSGACIQIALSKSFFSSADLFEIPIHKSFPTRALHRPTQPCFSCGCRGAVFSPRRCRWRWQRRSRLCITQRIINYSKLEKCQKTFRSTDLKLITVTSPCFHACLVNSYSDELNMLQHSFTYLHTVMNFWLNSHHSRFESVILK